MAKKKSAKKTVTRAQIKKGAAGLKSIGKAQKQLDLAIKKHKQHLVATYIFGSFHR